MSTRTPRLVIREADIDWHTETDEQGREWTNQPPPSYRPHYVVKVGANGETIWTSESLTDKSGAVRYARREAATHLVPLRIHRTWLGDDWVPVKGDPYPGHHDRCGTPWARTQTFTYRGAHGVIVEVKPR